MERERERARERKGGRGRKGRRGRGRGRGEGEKRKRERERGEIYFQHYPRSILHHNIFTTICFITTKQIHKVLYLEHLITSFIIPSVYLLN